jgi:hypothetical protein
MNILFYSNKCPYSRQLVDIIVKRGLTSVFRMVCVDDKGVAIPAAITNVPTLIIQGASKPLVGTAALNWISMQRYINISTCNSTVRVDNPQLDCPQFQGKEAPCTFIEDAEEEPPSAPALLTDGASTIADAKISEEQQDRVIDAAVQKRDVEMQILFHSASSRFK